MANIYAAEVKNLRDATGAGMMDSKKALEEADGNFDKAVEVLRVRGSAKAAKRGSERTAANGLVAAAENAMIELASETDFVAKNEQFKRWRRHRRALRGVDRERRRVVAGRAAGRRSQCRREHRRSGGGDR
jgi:translation elongation factor Ts